METMLDRKLDIYFLFFQNLKKEIFERIEKTERERENINTISSRASH